VATRALRIRVARVHARKSQEDIAAHLGIHPQTVKRMENGTAEISDERYFAIADFCEVPRRFMRHGFAADNDLAKELEAVTRERDAIRAELIAAFDRVQSASEFGRQVADKLRGA
jgi:transcriptional regulator with XRE-family HTH domain